MWATAIRQCWIAEVLGRLHRICRHGDHPCWWQSAEYTQCIWMILFSWGKVRDTRAYVQLDNGSTPTKKTWLFRIIHVQYMSTNHKILWSTIRFHSWLHQLCPFVSVCCHWLRASAHGRCFRKISHNRRCPYVPVTMLIMQVEREFRLQVPPRVYNFKDRGRQRFRCAEFRLGHGMRRSLALETIGHWPVRTFHARTPLAFPTPRTCSTKWNLSLNAVDTEACISGPVKDQSKRKVFDIS